MAKTRFGHTVTRVTVLTAKFQESNNIPQQTNPRSKKRQKTAAVNTEQPQFIIDFISRVRLLRTQLGDGRTV